MLLFRPRQQIRQASAAQASQKKSRHTGESRRPWRKWIPAFVLVRELKDGWVGTVRPSRQPRCGFLRMRWFLNAINNVRHGEERRRCVSNHARRPCRTRPSFRDQFLFRREDEYGRCTESPE
jgi:hypothetical protein